MSFPVRVVALSGNPRAGSRTAAFALAGRASGRTALFITHSVEEAVFLGTRVLVLSQHYTDDRGNDPSVKRGSRIVADYELPSAASSTKVKSSPAFLDLMQEIRRVGFSPDQLRHVTEFNLRHPDSFQTLTPLEKRK